MSNERKAKEDMLINLKDHIGVGPEEMIADFLKQGVISNEEYIDIISIEDIVDRFDALEGLMGQKFKNMKGKTDV